METNKNLFQELLKSDGIDPAGISETERENFRQMLASEKKRMNRHSSLSIGAMWIFAFVLIGLCMSEQLLEKLRIPFVAIALAITAAMWFVIIRYFPSHYKKTLQISRNIRRLNFLVHGTQRGIAVIGRKDGKHYIYWSRILIISVVLGLFLSLGGAGVFYLLCGRWIYSSSPWLHISFCIIATMSFLIFSLREGLKTPLEELTEVKTKSKQSKPDSQPAIWRLIMKSKITKLATAAVIIFAVMFGLQQFTGSIDGTSVVLADVAKKLEQIKNGAFKKTTTLTSQGNSINTFDSLVYYTEGTYREDIYDNEKLTKQVFLKPMDGIIVGVDHKLKVYDEMDLTAGDIEKFAPVSPESIVDLILSKGKYKKLGRKTVDGVLSEGFEFNDKRTMLSMDKDKIENVSMRLWVDVNTNLPVRVEIDGVMVLMNNIKANVVQYDPKWDVELESDFFAPKIPDDYVKPNQRGFIGLNTENWPTLKVVPGMAAEKAGLENGDLVLKVNGNSISHIKSSADALDLLLGKVGEKAVLTVKRAEQTLTFEIEREPAPK